MTFLNNHINKKKDSYMNFLLNYNNIEFFE